MRNRNAKVRKAGLFGSAISFTKLAAFRQIESDRFTVESCKSCVCPPLSSSSPAICSRVQETGVALAKKLIEKLMLALFARATFTRLDRRPNGAPLGDGLTLALYTLPGKTSPAHPL